MSLVHSIELSDRELAEIDERFEREPAGSIIEWAVESFHPHLCLTASMTDAVLIDLAVKVEPSIEVPVSYTHLTLPTICSV